MEVFLLDVVFKSGTGRTVLDLPLLRRSSLRRHSRSALLRELQMSFVASYDVWSIPLPAKYETAARTLLQQPHVHAINHSKTSHTTFA